MALRMSDDIAAAARRRTRAVVATAALVVLGLVAAVAGLAVALVHRGVAASPPAEAAASWPAAGLVPAASGPIGSVPPDDLSWVSVAGATVPVSTMAGPRDSAGGRARGFARTPLGAVLAAVHISVRLCPQAGPAVFEPTLIGQVVGADKDGLAAQLAEDYQAARAQLGLPYGAPAGRLYSTTTGYQVEMQGADAATVLLLIEGPGQDGGVLVALATHVQWTGSDWVLEAPTRGDWSTVASVVTDPSGYRRFGSPRAGGG
jgi:hypothetical protein